MTREEKNAQQRAYSIANKDKIAARMRAYNAANKDKKRAYDAANKDRIAACKRAYKAANKDRITAKRHERVASLSDGYVRELLAGRSNLKSADVPPELVELKRQHLKIHRMVMENDQ